MEVTGSRGKLTRKIVNKTTPNINVRTSIILLQQATFCQFAAKYYHIFLLKMVQVIFAVLDVSFCTLTTVAKLLRNFLTLISNTCI